MAAQNRDLEISGDYKPGSKRKQGNLPVWKVNENVMTAFSSINSLDYLTA